MLAKYVYNNRVFLRQSVFTALIIGIALTFGYRFLLDGGNNTFARLGLVSVTMEAGLEQATHTGKPLLLSFSAYWCGYCRRFDHTVLSDKQVQQTIAERVILARLEWDDPAAAPWLEFYGVQGFPTLLVVDGNGVILRRLSSGVSAADFVQQLSNL